MLAVSRSGGRVPHQFRPEPRLGLRETTSNRPLQVASQPVNCIRPLAITHVRSSERPRRRDDDASIIFPVQQQYSPRVSAIFRAGSIVCCGYGMFRFAHRGSAPRILTELDQKEA